MTAQAASGSLPATTARAEIGPGRSNSSAAALSERMATAVAWRRTIARQRVAPASPLAVRMSSSTVRPPSSRICLAVVRATVPAARIAAASGEVGKCPSVRRCRACAPAATAAGPSKSRPSPASNARSSRGVVGWRARSRAVVSSAGSSPVAISRREPPLVISAEIASRPEPSRVRRGARRSLTQVTLIVAKATAVARQTARPILSSCGMMAPARTVIMTHRRGCRHRQPARSPIPVADRRQNRRPRPERRPRRPARCRRPPDRPQLRRSSPARPAPVR